MSDGIRIRGLRIDTLSGATSQERARPQTVVLDLDISADLSRAAASDDLADTIDYGAVVDSVASLVRSTESKLLEHLAAKVISVVSRMDAVSDVTVEIAKLSPPVDERVEAIGVRIERRGA
jgi:dihydroneopterin aldolase